jgi:hypothetical protein
MRLASTISALLSGTRRLLASNLVCSFVYLSLPRCCYSLALGVVGVTATRFPSPPDLVQRQPLFAFHILSSSSSSSSSPPPPPTFARSIRLQAAPDRADQLPRGPGGGGGRMAGEAGGVDITAEEVNPISFSHLVDPSPLVLRLVVVLLLVFVGIVLVISWPGVRRN